MDQKVALLLMAAGQSKRMNQAKQLVMINEVPLICKMMSQLKSEQLVSYVVTGSYRNEVVSLIDDPEWKEIYNPEWKRGMGHSIATGVSEISDTDLVSGIIIVAVDQVRLKASHLESILDIHLRHPRCIIVSFYGKSSGIPVLFPSDLIPELNELDGDNGAKSVMREHLDRVIYYHLPEGITDLDSPQDLQEYIKSLSHENN